ncbi:hypothetical protein [Caulobacter henricii]|uniref:UrcA family protein n=1 Tax=Caulobacter henricii TaxID=69395 RepID=A0A0N7JHN3_9CAUL|nr:hypothetical protein [Caulobacter henricii]ALL13874.1 hypothetical protein AQ619_11305 [Caulobacter henricii]
MYTLKKFAALAAIVTVSAAIAAPASAANLVRVSLAGKTSVQISNEIKAAAEAVCANEKSVSVAACIESTTIDANRQLASLQKARTGATKVATTQEAVTIVRVSVKGKSTDQIHAEIRAAAEAVCKASKDFANRNEYQACVGGTVRAAKAQLQAMNNQPKQLAAM